MRKELQLDTIRSNLIRLEETIIFSLIERAQFRRNNLIYIVDGIKIPCHTCSFLEYLLRETEATHARIRRYTAPDEHPFTDNLPDPILPDNHYSWPIKRTEININNTIYSVYCEDIIPLICRKGDCGNYGSSAVCDVSVLQALSKRIHYGMYVAESKYLEDKKAYKKLIRNDDKKGIMDLLTKPEVEKVLLERVQVKTRTYGQDPWTKDPVFKIEPEMIAHIYKQWIIPLTKDIEYWYLKHRLD
jgi:chorismate mutase